ncbi:NAD(P)H-dependent oxidoreductase [Culicoidibacter larvae]|uniref:NAD(P)H-dependent oxidoreductase n=1 Tax=Culicoidibacter larvae TaxID=2579976 RepID=A0A5R8QH80_9FIRM|nr:NAD(P)H-dependent oxidoreductase [Culicoidibacter larvae]TLG77124.1 NAD(P)H-dependent oxidoreductase [Culicoidibacter larvae]
MSTTIETIMQAHNYRYACKQFDPNKKISPEDFQYIIETARLSPSSFGLEPWKFLLINDETIKNDLRPFSWGALRSLDGASHFLIVLARKDVKAFSPYVKHIMKDIKGYDIDGEAFNQQQTFFQNFQQNDFELLENKRTLFDWTSKQAYIPLANMMTTAAALGIDSCPIEGFNREAAESYLAEKNILDRETYGIAYMVSFGYRAEEQPIKVRQPLTDIFEEI